MKTKLLPVIIASLFVVVQTLAVEIVIDFEYDSRRIRVGATAKLKDDGTLIGKAKLEEIAKGDYFRVSLTHYSVRSGKPIYEGVAKFSVHTGEKISEEKVTGDKALEIFTMWPTG